MSFKQFRHFVGRLLGIRRYLFMAEPGKTLDLDALLGLSGEVPLRADWRAHASRLLAAHGHRPRRGVHCGACSADDLAWYAAAGFSQVLVFADASMAMPPLPPGLRVLRSDISVLRPHGGTGMRRADWERGLSEHGPEHGEYGFFNFSEAGCVTDVPAYAQVVRRRIRPDGAARAESATESAENGLLSLGLNRAFVGRPEADGYADAIYLRLPVVTMSDFGRNGRFGNQLFQRTYLRLVAQRQGAILQLPLWAGTALFGTKDPSPCFRPLPVVREETLDLAARRRLFAERAAGFAGLDFSGYGMLPAGLFAAHKDQIRSDHVFDPRLTERFERFLRPRLAGGKKLIVIHLRRGDYGYGQFFRAPCAWYQAWIAEQGFAPDDHTIFICSENPGQYRDRFTGFTVITADDLGTPPQLAPYFDFLAMTKADALAVANSSFSFFAAMLNAQAGVFARPDARHGALVPFDPWDAEPVLDQKLSPEEHARLKESD